MVLSSRFTNYEFISKWRESKRNIGFINFRAKQMTSRCYFTRGNRIIYACQYHIFCAKNMSYLLFVFVPFYFFSLLFSRGFQLRARVCHQDGDIFSYKTIHSVNKINSLFYRLQYWQDTAFYPVTHRLQSMYLTPLKGHALCTWRFAIGTLMSTIQLIKFPGPAFSKSN